MANKKDDVLFRPWKELKRLQDEKLHYFITRILYPFSPYYRRLFDKNNIKPSDIKTVEDLKKIPFTSKHDFLDLHTKDSGKKNLDFILQPNEDAVRKCLPKSEIIKISFFNLIKGKEYLKDTLAKEYTPIFLTATAGTTGKPVSFLYTSYDLENLKLYGKRIIEIFKIKQAWRVVNVFPYAPHLAFWQTVFAGFSGNVFILSTGGGKSIGTEGNINSIIKVRPQFLIGVADYIYHMLRMAREQNHDLSFISNIVLGASRLPQGFKRKVSFLLNEMGASQVKVLGTYGFTESRCAWAECPTEIEISSGYHTYPDKEVVEIIDPATGEVKGEGEDGEIVYTNIDARGTCVLRYRTGDLVKGGIIYSPCPYCKRTVPRITSDIYRASNIKNIQFSKIKGASVNLNALEHLLDDKEEIDAWQIEILKKDNDPYDVDELILYLSTSKDLNKEEFIEHLNQEVFSIVDVSFNRINFVSRSEIHHRTEIESAPKPKKILDNRPKL